MENVENILKRGFLELEDGNFDKAYGYFEEALKIDMEEPEGYLGKLLAEKRVASKEKLVLLEMPFDDSINYKRALRFADDKLKAELEGYIATINRRNREKEYSKAVDLMGKGQYGAAINVLQSLKQHMDVTGLIDECNEKIDAMKNDRIYTNACALFDSAMVPGQLEDAIREFEKIITWRDSQQKIEDCKNKIEILKKGNEEYLKQQQKLKEERKAKTKKLVKKLIIIASIVIVTVVAAGFTYFNVIKPKMEYDKAVELMENGEYIQAADAFIEMGKPEKANEANYLYAQELLENGQYAEAIEVFDSLNGYEDSEEQINEANYLYAQELLEDGQYAEAIEVFANIDLDDDSKEKIYLFAQELLEADHVTDAMGFLISIGDYKDSEEIIASYWDSVAVRETMSVGYEHIVALKEDGTVVACGNNEDGQCNVSDWTDIIAVSAKGCFRTIGLKKDGTVVATGYNDDGQCDVSGWTDIVAVSVGSFHTVGLKNDGTVVACGRNSSGQCDVSGWTDIVAISAGYCYTAGLKADGTVVVCGSDIDGEDVCRWDISLQSDIVAISAGDYHLIVLDNNGRVSADGDERNSSCQVSRWTNIVAISASDYHSVGLKEDGSVVICGQHIQAPYFNAPYSETTYCDRDGLCVVSDWTDIVAISAGGHYTAGLKKDGTVVLTGTPNISILEEALNWTNIKIPE